MNANNAVIYKWNIHRKINGTVFYCYEYYCFLKKYIDIDFYIVDISEEDLKQLTELFYKKYNTFFPIRTLKNQIELYKLNLNKTLIFDIITFESVKYFLTNQIFVYSNDTHDMFRYSDNREITYYGSYEYQRFDKYQLLKFDFTLYPQFDTIKNETFVSYRYKKDFEKDHRVSQYLSNKNIVYKNMGDPINIFETCKEVVYIHVGFDKNNRIIPEAVYYNIPVVYFEEYDSYDSAWYRLQDIQENGILKYQINIDDILIQDFLC